MKEGPVMSTLEKLKAEKLTSRKIKNGMTSFYSLVISECESIGKSKGRAPTEDEVQSVLKKVIESNGVTVSELRKIPDASLTKSDLERFVKLGNEIRILEDLRPEMVNEDVLRSFISGNCTGMAIGQAMGKIKSEYGASVDMGFASKIVKENL